MSEGIMNMGMLSKKKSPDALLADALGAFETAQVKVTSAIDAINDQVIQTQEKIDNLQSDLDNATTVRERLERVGERIKEFVS